MTLHTDAAPKKRVWWGFRVYGAVRSYRVPFAVLLVVLGGIWIASASTMAAHPFGQALSIELAATLIVLGLLVVVPGTSISRREASALVVGAGVLLYLASRNAGLTQAILLEVGAGILLFITVDVAVQFIVADRLRVEGQRVREIQERVEDLMASVGGSSIVENPAGWPEDLEELAAALDQLPKFDFSNPLGMATADWDDSEEA